MALDDTITSLLTKLVTSLESTNASVPESTSILPPQDGISLLDVKTDLFLSYLQNIVFLILLKLKSHSQDDDSTSIADEVVKKLVELRVYLEKGVRPLEGRLKYQIDKVIRAADTATRQVAPQKPTTKTTNGDASGSDDEASDDDEASEIDDLAHRPNLAAFAGSAQPATSAARSSIHAEDNNNNTGIYRPPRITPTSLPTTTPAETNRPTSRKPTRSAAVDEYITTELSTAPSLEPSIGSTIVSGGRGTKTARDRVQEAERTAYEENNFVRLPALSKKEMARQRGRRDGQYGGEEMRDLGGDLDRIERVTSGKRKATGRLENGGKDGPRGDGFGGVVSAKRRKMGGKRR